MQNTLRNTRKKADSTMTPSEPQVLIDAIKRMRGDKYDDKESVFFNIGALEIEVFYLHATIESLKAMTE